jgi:hypothetical protein
MRGNAPSSRAWRFDRDLRAVAETGRGASSLFVWPTEPAHQRSRTIVAGVMTAVWRELKPVREPFPVRRPDFWFSCNHRAGR